ncbi:chondroitinase-AC [Pedobacter sp.]|uniref:chondroitinase-AC n=1 Tax=Pedobacter sp. TaxID=1411316 RepID=UPI003D7F4F06
MNKLILIFTLLISIHGTGLVRGQTTTKEVIKGRILVDLKKQARFTDQPAANHLNTLKSNGSWEDVNYKDQAITNWLPNVHLMKLETLIQAYINKESKYYGDEKVFNAISSAFKYWYESDPKSENWWHNEIGTPQALGEMLIMLDFGSKKLDADLRANLIGRMKRGDPEKQTGANKTDVALHFFYRALLTNDETLLSASVTNLFDPIRFVYNKEGLQFDYAYLQHGLQLQISSYGAVFITGILKLANYVRDTPYALHPKKLALFSKYYRDSYLKAIRGSYMDFNVEGRGVSRPDILKKKSEKSRLNVAKLIDFKNAEDWSNAIARTDSTETPAYKISPYHHQYWTGDYSMHLRPSYSFNVRMVSTRTRRSEAGNKENLLGRYLSDGATNIQLRGPEYYNIMPVWEWDKIPGVTSRDYATDRPITQFWGEEGSNEFAGGVSDGVYGASAYALNFDSLEARKAWFFFDNEIVCLGAGIKSKAAENITTTLNQSWLNGNVLNALNTTKIGRGKTLEFKEKSQYWIWHDGVGYYFPEGGDINLSTQRQKGNWYHINNSHSREDISGDVFKLWVNHGKKPLGASYAYLVLPGVKGAAEMKKINGDIIKIAANTAAVQGVWHQELEIAMVVFYQPGKLILPTMELSSDKACLVMVRNVNGKQVISVADPMQKEVHAVINIKDLKTGSTISHEINFPKDEFVGSTVMN